MRILGLPIASHFLTGGILSLALPLAVLIAVIIWYVILLRGGFGES
ncbi:MAG TPA: hypothetical protein VMD79_15635 [Solirubrobacteraceae bacterium]|nr:hypothetical protein [Solirubrobacteraceae bacterium]